MSLTSMCGSMTMRLSGGNSPGMSCRLPGPGTEPAERSMGQQIGESLQGPIGLVAAVLGTSLGFGGMREGLQKFESAKLPSANVESGWAKERARLRKEYALDGLTQRYGLQHSAVKHHAPVSATHAEPSLLKQSQ